MKEPFGIDCGDPSAAGNDRVFMDGSTRSFTVLRTAVVGYGTYRPGWKWSLHAKPQVGKESERHIGYVVSGAMMVKDSSGNLVQIDSGCAFEIGPGSDAWVLGNEPCIALDFTPIGE